MNHALDHHFHGHPEKLFTQHAIAEELALRAKCRRMKPTDMKHWKMKKGQKTNAA